MWRRGLSGLQRSLVWGKTYETGTPVVFYPYIGGLLAPLRKPLKLQRGELRWTQAIPLSKIFTKMFRPSSHGRPQILPLIWASQSYLTEEKLGKVRQLYILFQNCSGVRLYYVPVLGVAWPLYDFWAIANRRQQAICHTSSTLLRMEIASR